MCDQDLEIIYDDLYQMCLLAFLCLEQKELPIKVMVKR